MTMSAITRSLFFKFHYNQILKEFLERATEVESEEVKFLPDSFEVQTQLSCYSPLATISFSKKVQNDPPL